VGNPAGTVERAGVVSGVTVGEGVGFGVSSFGTGVALTTAIAVGIVLGVRLGAGVADTVGAGVGDADDELTPLVEAKGKSRSKCWPSASATLLTLSGRFAAASKTL
jgi:hypothetical protein